MDYLQAKKKWNAEAIHVDGTQKLTKVDGYEITLQKTDEQDDDLQINPEYSE